MIDNETPISELVRIVEYGIWWSGYFEGTGQLREDCDAAQEALVELVVRLHMATGFAELLTETS